VSSIYTPPRHGTLILERSPEAPHEPESVVDAPLVGFDAFLVDSRIYGWVRLSADRVTDLLNGHTELTLVNAQVERFSDGRLSWHDRLVVARDQLVAVRAAAPRGDPSRRLRTRLYPLVVQSASFLIGGYLHAPPGMAPLAEIAARPLMTPLSSAWLEFWRDGRRQDQWVGTIIFNRDLVDAIEVVSDEDLEFGMTSWPIRGRAAR
jgi:hypothetical protein